MTDNDDDFTPAATADDSFHSNSGADSSNGDAGSPSIFSAADGFLGSDDDASAHSSKPASDDSLYAFDEFVAQQSENDQSEDNQMPADDYSDVDELFNELPSAYERDKSHAPAGEHALSRTDRRRRRQRRRKRVLIACILVCAFLALSAGGLWFVKTRYPQLLRGTEEKVFATQDYPGPGTGSVEFTISKGESSASVARRLASQGIVSSADVFMNAVLNANAESRLQPGTFNLKYRMRSTDVVAILTNPAKATGMVEVLTNSRLSDVAAQMVQDSKDWTAAEVQAAIDSKGAGILPAEANGSFEGWLEPGTYDPKSYSTPSQMLKAMVDARIQQLDSLGVPTGQQRERILTIASIIGGEVNQTEYYGKVSRVIENRLAKNMPLGMDSIVAYGNNVSPHALTQAMLTNTTNPYNSRIQKGLPPTPIDQPDAEMIKAAMNPTPGNWLYFVTVNLNTGETKFTDNINDFNKYKAQYEQWEQQQN